MDIVENAFVKWAKKWSIFVIKNANFLIKQKIVINFVIKYMDILEIIYVLLLSIFVLIIVITSENVKENVIEFVN
jgi:hypothetical protein